jgi:hypothetical protein
MKSSLLKISKKVYITTRISQMITLLLTLPINRGLRLAGAKEAANASVYSLRAVCGRCSIPSMHF